MTNDRPDLSSSDSDRTPEFANKANARANSANNQNLESVFEDFTRFYAETVKTKDTPVCIIM